MPFFAVEKANKHGASWESAGVNNRLRLPFWLMRQLLDGKNDLSSVAP